VRGRRLRFGERWELRTIAGLLLGDLVVQSSRRETKDHHGGEQYDPDDDRYPSYEGHVGASTSASGENVEPRSHTPLAGN
jgi:hypothetical protein